MSDANKEIDFRVLPALQKRAAMHALAAKDALDAFNGMIGSVCNCCGQDMNAAITALDALRDKVSSELALAGEVAVKAANQATEAMDD